MATNKTQEELRQEAIENLAASRSEIGAEIQRLRTKLSPKLILHRLVDHHTGAVVCVAIATGATASMLIFRHKPSGKLNHTPKPRIADTSVPRTTIGSHILRVLAGSILPALVKSTVASLLHTGTTRPSASASFF